jgi:hypothetical protein
MEAPIQNTARIRVMMVPLSSRSERGRVCGHDRPFHGRVRLRHGQQPQGRPRLDQPPVLLCDAVRGRARGGRVLRRHGAEPSARLRPS